VDDPIFKVKDTSFSYDGTPILKQVSCDFHKGVFYGILGPNGCGKTTFLDVMAGYSHPDAGCIYFSGKTLKKRSKTFLAQHIALVAQNYYINFPYTVEDVVMMGRYPHIPRFASPSELDYEIVTAAMEITGVLPFKKQYVTELSGGERQRTVFARGIAQDTGVLLLDEATSNLDINYTIHLLDRIKNRVKEKALTVISVFQDINLAAIYCDEMVFMDQGTIVAAGATDEMMDEILIEKVFKVKSEIRFEPFYQARQALFRTGSEQ